MNFRMPKLFNNLLHIFDMAHFLARGLLVLMAIGLGSLVMAITWHNQEVDLRARIVNQQRWLKVCPNKAEEFHKLLDLKAKHDILLRQFPSSIVLGHREEVSIDYGEAGR